MPAHVLFDRPYLDQGMDTLALYVTGTLPDTAPLVAYEARLDIHNANGLTCTVDDLVTGTLPSGYSLEVDNDAVPLPQIVLRWPAFQSADVPIPNEDFEDGNSEWDLGYGWDIGTTSPPTPPPEFGSYAAKFLRRGDAYMRMKAWTPCAPGQAITARARINPVNKRSGSQARVYLEFYDAAFNRIAAIPGSIAEYADEWEWSTVTATAPAGTAYVKIAVWGKHDITGRNGWQTRPLLVDRVEWDYTGEATGAGSDATYCITLRARCLDGRTALWSGCVDVTSTTGEAPTTLSGLTFWYDGDNSAHYIDTDQGGGVPVNGSHINRADSAAAIDRGFANAGTDSVRNIPVVGSANGFTQDTFVVSSPLGFQERPVPTGDLGAATQLNTLLSVNNALMIFAVNITAADVTTGTTYTNARLIADDSGYIGVHFYRHPVNPTITLDAYNFAGGETKRSATLNLNQWYVITFLHRGGFLYLRINGVEVVAPIASGNTDITTTFMQLGTQSTVKYAQFCTARLSNTDAAILEVERFFGSKVGIVI